jgi:hypothetical protein
MPPAAPDPTGQEPDGEVWRWALLAAATLLSAIGIYAGVVN